MIRTSCEEYFRKLLYILDKLKSLDNIPDFFQKQYYHLLMRHVKLIPENSQRKCLKLFKVKCWNAIVPYVESAQRESDILKRLILYLRTTNDCRSAIANLQLQEFCSERITLKMFIENILNLEEPNNEDLPDLQSATELIRTQESIFMMDKFIDIIQSYSFIITPKLSTKNNRQIIEVDGKLIIISEIYADLLKLKSSAIEELHIVGADVVHIDTNLEASHWSGTNIVILAKCIKIHGNVTWDISGKNGQKHQSKAENGTNCGDDGNYGVDGFAGESGGNMCVVCNNIIHAEQWTIISRGGNGGNGQDGGNGVNGKNGEGVCSATFELHFVSRKPKAKIWNSIPCPEIFWSNSETFRLNFWDSGHVHVRGPTSDGKYLTYSYYAHWIPGKGESYLLYTGSQGQTGGRSGKGGIAGAGGFGGEISIACAETAVIKIDNVQGAMGNTGKHGTAGAPGKNGWDMGYIFRNGYFSKTCEIIGKYQNRKLCVKEYKYRNEETYIYCPYRKYEEREKCYIEITTASNKCSVLNRNTNIMQEKPKSLQSVAVRTKAISRSTISDYLQNMNSDIMDEITAIDTELNDILHQAKEESVEKNEETENLKVDIRRQATFIPVHTRPVHSHKTRKNTYTSEPSVCTNDNDLLECLVRNASDVSAWLSLHTTILSYENFDEIFRMLYSNKSVLNDNYASIICLILNKYRLTICNSISEIGLLPINNDNFTPVPVENYLMPTKNVKEFVHDDLGTLNDYFYVDDEEHRQKLVTYTKTITISSILNPLKLFIGEHSLNDDIFKNKLNFLKEIYKFDDKLKCLAKCYLVAYETNKDSAILKDIKKRQEIINSEFSIVGSRELLESFYEHILRCGTSSVCVRELLSCIYTCNIKIYVRNTDSDLILHYDHNASSLDTLILENCKGIYTELAVPEEHAKLLQIRHYLGYFYSNILRCTDTFYCKKQFDNFLSNLDIFEVQTYPCFYCRGVTDNLIKDILNYFSNDNKYLVQLRLKKLTPRYIGNNHILCTLLRRFKVEGNYISFQELAYFVNFVLKSVVENSTNLCIFEWIFTSKSQDKWVNEIYFLELENYFKCNLLNNISLKANVAKVKQTDLLLLMSSKLDDMNDKITLDNIEKCFAILKEITVDITLVENFPLSTWQYIMREKLVEHKFETLVTWKSEDLHQAQFYSSCLETVIGSKLIDRLLSILKRKSGLTSTLILDIFSYLHNQEWSLNDAFLDHLTECEVKEMKLTILGPENERNDERSLTTLLNLIKMNVYTSEGVLQLLTQFENYSFLEYDSNETFNENQIIEWSKQFKKDINVLAGDDKRRFIQDNIVKAINIIIQVVEMKREFKLRKTQRLAILLLLSYEHNTLAQISTGEGKSLIVVCSSIFKALCGQKVDIITSSSVLAVRDAKIHKDIFTVFDIKVSHNCSDDLNERKEAYSGSQVVYGDLANFQRDYLLDRFYDKNIIGNRDYDNLIVDEVDSMLLDKGNNTLYLSHDIPGLDKLESVYLYIWKCVNFCQNTEGNDIEQDIKEAILYDLYGTLTETDLELILKLKKEEAKEVYAWLYKNNIVEKGSRLSTTFTDADLSKIPSKFSKYLHKLSYMCKKIQNRAKEISIPKCLYSFVERHLDFWIKNAFLASSMEEGHDYVVDVDRTASQADINPNIIIIDKGTGTDQSNSQWEEALHQFLQLKHGCKLLVQSLKAVFISNVSYFKKYRKLIGLTGTLGLQMERDLLQELYNVHFVNVPTSKPKKIIEHEPINCNSKSDWIFKIVNRTKEILNDKRSVLIICETITDVNNVQQAFHSADMQGVIVYKREYEECTMAQGQTKLDGCRIIIATNLAGRGTDIKISDALNEVGGLHVLLTYLPTNDRIEQQAFGRAARSGCNGSAQLVVIIEHGNFLHMRTERNFQELQRISDIKNYYDTRIKVEEQFFDKFSEVFKKLKNEYENSSENLIALQRILDRWAFWLDHHGIQLSNSKIHNLFEDFLEEIKSNFMNWTNWGEDPFQLTKLGLDNVLCKKYHEAIKIFDLVIEKEPRFCEAAHYYKAASLASILDFKNKNKLHFTMFLKELLNAERLFEIHRDACSSACVFVQNLKQIKKNNFIQIDAYKNQQDNFMILYDFYIGSIRNILGQRVTNESFQCQDISADISENMYDYLISKNILSKAIVNECQLQDITEISNTYGLNAKLLHNFLSSFAQKCIEENDFLTKIKDHVKLPSAEEFWDILIKNNILINELEFVIVDKTVFDNLEDFPQNIEEIYINIKSNDKKRIYNKPVNFVGNSYYVFHKDTVKSKLGAKKFNKMEKEGVFTSNKVAQICRERISEPLIAYDRISSEHLAADDISETEAKEILITLVRTGFLKEISSDLYQLQDLYDESKILDMPPYTQSIKSVFKCRFAYRIAMQNLTRNLEESKEAVFIDLISEPHVDVIWDLINRKIIEPVYVTKLCSKEEIAEIVNKVTKDIEETETIINAVQNILSERAGNLYTLDVPNIILKPIENSLDELQTSPLQELHIFALNTLNYVLQSEEKGYTLRMILSTTLVMILGALQTIVGLSITVMANGFFINAGLAVIEEGMGDIIRTLNAWKTGYFSWNDYGQYKLCSIASSVLTVGIGMTFSKVKSFSRFGTKIASKGKASMTGKGLIKNTSLQQVGLEMGRVFIKKATESVMRSTVDMRINGVMDTHLENFCNNICQYFLQDLSEAAEHHNIVNSLEEVYRTLGPKLAEEKVLFYKNKYFAERILLSNIISKAQSLIDSVIRDFGTAVEKGSNSTIITCLTVVSNVLRCSNYVVNLVEIRNSTLALLDNINDDLKKEVHCATKTGEMLIFTECEIEEFKCRSLLQFRKALTENAQYIFKNNIIRPIADACTTIMFNKMQNYSNVFFGHARNQYQSDQFKNKKLPKIEKKMPTKVEKMLKESYYKSLLKLRSKVRDRNLYADIVAENGPMDIVCIQACLTVLSDVFKKYNIAQKLVKIFYKTSSGMEQEFCSEGKGEPIVINLHVENNHFVNIHGNPSSSGDYNCLYETLLTDIPELNLLLPNEFRNEISDAIRTDENVQFTIIKGYQQDAISQEVYDGYEEKEIISNEIHDNLLNSTHGLSQSSVSNHTSSKNGVIGIHLPTLAKSMQNNEFQEDPINAVQKKKGRLIYLDNKLSVAASKVAVSVSIFVYDEILPNSLQQQYDEKKVGLVTNPRIKRSNSFTGSCPVDERYHPKQVRIGSNGNIESNPASLDKFNKMGCILYNRRGRSRSSSRA